MKEFMKLFHSNQLNPDMFNTSSSSFLLLFFKEIHLLQNSLILQTGKSMTPTLLSLLDKANFCHG